jgi:hypothetical protein
LKALKMCRQASFKDDMLGIKRAKQRLAGW